MDRAIRLRLRAMPGFWDHGRLDVGFGTHGDDDVLLPKVELSPLTPKANG